MRPGVKDMGCSFRLAYFRPASGLNEETWRLHAANFFAVARQVRYSTRNEKSLDMVLFVDGKGACVVSCQRSPEPVFLTWRGSKRRRRAISSCVAAREP